MAKTLHRYLARFSISSRPSPLCLSFATRGWLNILQTKRLHWIYSLWRPQGNPVTSSQMLTVNVEWWTIIIKLPQAVLLFFNLSVISDGFTTISIMYEGMLPYFQFCFLGKITFTFVFNLHISKIFLPLYFITTHKCTAIWL